MTTTTGQYAIKCDECKAEIGRTDDVGASAAGGFCTKCKEAHRQARPDSDRLAEIAAMLSPICGLNLRELREHHMETIRRANSVANRYR